MKLRTINNVGVLHSLEVRNHCLWLSFSFLKIFGRKIQVTIKAIQLLLRKSRQQKHTNDAFHYVTSECWRIYYYRTQLVVWDFHKGEEFQQIYGCYY